MELDLDQSETVQVRPVLFLVKDACGRPSMLILDFDRLDLLLKPSPDGDGTDELEMGLKPLVPNSFLFRHAAGGPWSCSSTSPPRPWR